MDTIGATGLSEALLGKTRGAVLGLLLGRPDEEFYVRQVARLSGATLGPVQRELKLLSRVGVLTCRQVGRQLLYTANRESPIYPELRGLAIKTVGIADLLKAALKPLAGQMRVVFVFGSFAQGRQHSGSDVDVMIVGDVPFTAVAGALAAGAIEAWSATETFGVDPDHAEDRVPGLDQVADQSLGRDRLDVGDKAFVNGSCHGALQQQA